MFNESCAQPGVTIVHLVGDLSSCRRTQRYCYIGRLSRIQNLAPQLQYFFLKIVYLILSVLGLRCCVGFSLVAESGGYSPVSMRRKLLIVLASLLAEFRL